MKFRTEAPKIAPPDVPAPIVKITDVLYATKRCLRCGHEKRLHLYAVDKRQADGKSSTCKSCSQPRVRPRAEDRRSKTKTCRCCDRTKSKTEFAKREWMGDGYDSTCKSCRPVLRLEKGISSWVHDYDLTPEEVVAIRLLGETRASARDICVRHALEYIWFIDRLEKWRCEDSGRPLAMKRRGGRKPAFEPFVKLMHPRKGFIPSNCKIVART